MNKTILFIFLAFLAPVSRADQGGFTNSGGTASPGAITSSVANPAGTLTISGTTFTYLSTDGTTSVIATISGGVYTESCAGGGKGGHVTCGYSFSGTLNGTLTVNGQTQAITGVTYQS